jgi:exodeoxyribonuclease VII large subunit
LRTLIERRRERYDGLNRRLQSGLVANAQAHRMRVTRDRDRVVVFRDRAQRAMLAMLKYNNARVERAERLLAAFSYREVLKRGFALVRDDAGHPVHSAAAVGAGTRVEIEFADGRVGALADGTAAAKPSAKTSPRPAAKPRGRDTGSSGQGNLFG